MDYYTVLELKRDASDADIKAAYRALAARDHPSKARTNKDEATLRFKEIAEAYEVLSDGRRRAVFDQYGEKGLKEGVPNGKGGMVPGWTFSRSPDAMYAEFFGSASPYADLLLGDGPTSASALFAAVAPPREMKRPPAQELNLYCSLEELFHGATKKIKVTRQRVEADGKTVAAEERVLTVEVRPGWRAGTKIAFPGEGDQTIGTLPGEVVLTLREKPHPIFTRSGTDLCYTAPISLLQALCGATITLTTLDRRTLPIALTDIIRLGSAVTLEGEGMPSIRAGGARGNLVITFAIEFPAELTLAQKAQLRTVLPP